MTESELYKELGKLTKDRDKWETNIPYVSSLLTHNSVKIQAKALWLLGETGLEYPLLVQDEVPEIAAFFDNRNPLLRERAVNALGRIGRGSYHVIEQYWKDLFRFASDENAKVRRSFIWASENIATNTPEIFRVLGKRRPEFVQPYLKQLKKISETDDNRVVRIHCLGAVRAAGASDSCTETVHPI